MQYKWQCEGVEHRGRRRNNLVPVTGSNAFPIGPNPKTLSSILETTIAATKNDDFLDNHHTLLSPQRRGFSSGCKAASPPKSADKSHHQQPSSSRSRWQIKNNGIDFKPAFQKNALEANSRSSRSNNAVSCGKEVGHSSSWNTSGHSKQGDLDRPIKGRRFGDRERTRSSNTESDQVPEWMDAGPTSVFDVIELKGFDDDEREQSATEKKRKRSKGRKDSNGNNHLKASSETSTGPTQKSSSSRQKRHSSGDCAPNNNNKNTSRPSSRNKTPQRTDSSFSKQSSHSPVRVIQASELELSILREHQEKLEKEKSSSNSADISNTFDLFAALGIQPPKDSACENDKTTAENKLPNSDAEFAACILGLPIDQIAKIMPNVLPSVNNNNNINEPQQQTDQPTTSRLIRWQKANLNAATSENNISKMGDEEMKVSIKKDLMNNEETKMSKHLLSLRAANFVPQQPFVFNPRNSSSPAQTFQPSSISQHQRPASAEYSRLFAASSPFPSIDPHCSPPPQLTHLFNSSGASIGKFTNFPMGTGMHSDFSAQRGALIQQMQAHIGQNLDGGDQFQQQQQQNISSYLSTQQQQFLDQFRKRPTPPSSSLVLQQSGPFPSGGHQQQNIFGGSEQSNPSMFSPQQQQQRHTQSPLSQISGGGSGGPLPHHHLPPSFHSSNMPHFGGNTSLTGGGNGTFSTYFQHVLMETARQMSLNPHLPPDESTLQLAFSKLYNDPKMRHLIVNNVGGGSFNHSMAAGGAQQLPPPPFQAPHFGGVPGGGPGPFGGGHQFPGGGHQFGPSQHLGPNNNNFVLPPYAMPFTPTQQFFPFGTGPGGLNHHQNRQHSQYHHPMTFPPPLVNPQQQSKSSSTTHNQNLLNSPAFMPTSVMRQMSKMPGGGSSVNSGGDSTSGGGGGVGTSNNAGGGLTSNNSSALLQKMFAEAKRNEPQASGRAILGRDPTFDIGVIPTSAENLGTNTNNHPSS